MAEAKEWVAIASPEAAGQPRRRAHAGDDTRAGRVRGSQRRAPPAQRRRALAPGPSTCRCGKPGQQALQRLPQRRYGPSRSFCAQGS